MEAFCLAVAGCSTKQLRQAFPPYLQMGTLQLLNCTWRNASLVWDNMRSLRSAVTQSSTGSGTHLDLQIVKPQAHTMRGVLNRVILRSLRAPSKPRAIKTFLICVMHLLYPSLKHPSLCHYSTCHSPAEALYYRVLSQNACLRQLSGQACKKARTR